MEKYIINRNNKNIIIRNPKTDERKRILEFHIDNHLKISVKNKDEEQMKAQKDDIPEDFPYLLDDVKFKAGIYLIAELEETKEIIGCIGLNTSDEIHTMWLTTFSVSEQFRKNGIGTYLFDKIIKIAKDLKVKKLKLVTLDEYMKDAIKIYESNGFTKTKKDETKYYKVLWYEKMI